MMPPGTTPQAFGGVRDGESDAVEIERLRTLQLLIREEYRWHRERRNPIAALGRGIHGAWRSIITGGWE